MELIERVGTGRYALPTRVDPARTDLVAEFEADPHAWHGDDLALLLGLLRTSTDVPRLVLLVNDPDGPWALAEAPARRGEPARPLPGAVFDSRADAERFAFRLRWAALGGDAADTAEAAR